MGYVVNTISGPKALTLIALGILYLVNGVYGYAWAKNSASLTSRLVYFTKDIVLRRVRRVVSIARHFEDFRGDLGRERWVLDFAIGAVTALLPLLFSSVKSNCLRAASKELAMVLPGLP